MALRELPRQAEQKSSKPLIGVVFPKQQQQFLAVPDLRAHDLENFVLNVRIFSGQFLETIDRNFADGSDSRCSGLAVVLPIPDSVKAQQFTRYMKTHHLNLPVFSIDAGFYRPASNDIDIFERLSHAIQDFATLKHLLLFDDTLK